MSIDYSKIGLKAGLEVHQQLDTAAKLFCSCKPQLFKGEPEVTFLRRLRPTQSELGQVDPAALFEFQKGVKILYEATGETACLVEMDEEPPRDLNREAVEIALIAALMMQAKPVDEIHVMRKTVIDGSNTTGFQRTCVVALNGEINIKGKKVPIQHVSLEEDAARKMGEEARIIRYRIDRLGIPLIEVTTAPVVYSPQEAEETALTIGRILRATGKVRRGLGTIRQDLNISIRDGALIEIKGVQELDLVSRVIENEVQRQLSLLKIRDELKERGVKKENIKEEFVDVTSGFKQTKCKVILKALEQNKQVLAVKLPKFAGLLKRELALGMRLGAEMADIASFWGRVGGIFHTDELPAYGITVDEVNQIGRLMKKEPLDAVVFVADTLENATDALKAVAQRAREAVKGVPEETRAANPDGTTRYMRPRPGAARMYPETDVPPIQLTKEYFEKLRSRLPELPEQKLRRLIKEYGLNQKLAKQILDSEYGDLFETAAKETEVSPTVIAVALTETLKALGREGINVEAITDRQFRDLFSLIESGETAKEAIPEIITWLSKHDGATAKEAIENLGLAMISRKELERIIDDLMERNKSLVKERGKGAFGPLMGMIMKKVRGRVKAEMVSGILKKRLEE
ncbi:MAG: Glu-tRNA(Gln) amidotransferase subunit GatE, partial [Candidatus Bathyarchaeota archaeon]|nr:Glu-tRNA(Gln) amidotransferase subunit GatE [Candidatus Bathyarchaeota archaeon]